MTKEITKAIILQEMQDKLKLREFDPAAFLFDETVVPVYEIAPHLLKTVVKSKTLSITSGPDPYMFFEVSGTERWHISGYNVIFITGSYKVAGMLLYRKMIADYFYIDLTKNQTVSYAVNLPKELVVNPGEKIFLYVDDYTSTGNLELRLDVKVEELR